jgi:hypothetical protein
MKLGNDPEQFIKENTYLQKYVVECAVCHHKGYRPDTPDPVESGPIYRYLRRLFEELALDENGVCGQCKAALR